MPIFIKENQELNKQTYKIPNDLQKHLKQTLSKYNGYTQNKGYKRLNSLVNPKYNKRSDKTDNFKDGKHITFSDMKRIDHDFRHMDKNPKNIERILNGGEEMASFVKNKLNQERTRVAPILKQKKIDTRNKNQVKPTVKPMKVPSINNVKVNIHENNDIYEHQRGDLSSIFINGGSEVLTKISENIKHKKIYIKEEHLNILKNLKE